MRKVLAAALICAVSSAFASWDMFPIKDAGKGEAKLGVQYNIPGEDISNLGLNLGIRYSIIEGLEAALMLGGPGYVLTSSAPDIAPGVEAPKATGLNQPVIGLRYWLPMGLGIFADVALPFGSEKIVGSDPDVGLNAGLQYSTKFNEQLSLGSEIHTNKDLDLGIAAELDYSLGSITSWVAVDMGLSKPLGVGLAVGVIYDISETLYVDASFWIGLAGDAYKDNKPKSISADVGINF